MGLAHRVTSLTTIVFSLRYSLLNLFCSALFLFGMFIQYVLFGTTEFLQIENLLSYYSVYHSSETFFFWLSSVSLLLMLSPILLKLGFFPFNALITDVYPGVSFPFFTGYATFYNFGVLLIFFYLLFGPYSVLFSFLLPYLFVVLLGTLAVSIIGFVVVDYSFQSSLGLLSAGTSSLVILVFLSVITFFDTDFVETTASLLGGLFFYFLTLYFFLNFVNSAASNYSFSTFKVIGDFKNLKFNSVTISFFLFLLSGLPPTVIFFFKLAVFANTLQFAILLIAVLGQVTFLFLYAKWASAVLTDVKLIAQSTSSSLAEAVPLA